MSPPLSLLGPFLVLALLFQCVSLQSAPALVWSNQEVRSPESVIRFNTLVDQIEPSDLLLDYTKSKVPIVAFVQENLNVEQFAANDAPFVSTLFDNLELNPVLYTNVKTPQKIYASFKTDAVTNENRVIYLPGKTLKENDDIIKSHAERLNASGPVVFILIGEKNEYLEQHKRAARQAPGAPAKASKGAFGYAPTPNPCVLYYATGASAILAKKETEPETISFGPPTLGTKSAVCNTTVPSWATSLELDFKTDPAKNDLALTFTFANVTGGGWSISKIETTISGNPNFGTFDVNVKSLPIVSSRFSFSCQKTVLAINNTEYSGTLTIESFQVQPYFTSPTADATTLRFDSSSDCAVWFTLPIWMGLIVSLILIAILYSGVIALMSIITPDRFENPKGRGLIITNVEE